MGMVTHKVVIAGIPLELQRKRIKNMHLYVKAPDGHVIISAPMRMPEREIAAFVEKHREWIAAKIQEMQQRPNPVERKYVEGDRIPLWGQYYTLHLVTSAEYNVQKREKTREIVLFLPRGSGRTKREHLLREFYRRELEMKAAELAPKWEAKTGLYAKEWRTKVMKTRWGTCNIVKRRIWLNVQLAEKPVECLEQVILHELLHLVERYHNKHFYALMTHFMPNWKEIKNRLENFGRGQN